MAKVSVEIRSPKKPNEILEFEQAQIVIGRERGDITLGDPQCSGSHAELAVSDDGVVLSDLDSTNGTFTLDGSRVVRPMPLVVGSEFKIGECVLILKAHVRAASALPAISASPISLEPAGATLVPPKVGAGLAPIRVPPPPSSGKPKGPLPPPSVPPPAVSSEPSSRRPVVDVPPPNVPPPSIQPARLDIPAPNVPMSERPSSRTTSGRFASRPPVEAISSNVAAPGVESLAFLRTCLDDFRPHAIDAIKPVALFVLPVQLVAGVLGMVPIIGGALQSVTGLLLSVGYAVFGLGVMAEAALRLSAGKTISTHELWAIQLKRTVPWFLGILVPLMIAAGASLFLLVPGLLLGGMLLPIYMLEGRKDFEANKRNFELVQTNWALAIVPHLLVVLPIALALSAASFVVGLVPFIGSVLASLLAGVAMSVVGPLWAYLSFRTYIAIREGNEKIELRAQLEAKIAPQPLTD